MRSTGSACPSSPIPRVSDAGGPRPGPCSRADAVAPAVRGGRWRPRCTPIKLAEGLGQLQVRSVGDRVPVASVPRLALRRPQPRHPIERCRAPSPR
ncbi:unspecified product [Leishmania tarentolae]|uniref:Unspecified product n=1 Tax=Leishmania tarentolae TaxID=5689 RepID=A0A640L245_LEITA|nr:unspecified product [Leishmania tarentolae]